MMNDNNTAIQILKVGEINEHPLNQEIFDRLPDEKREALKLSIMQNGLINPITVMAFKRDGKTSYYVVSGHNRLSVLKESGITQAACKIVYPKKQGQDLDILITDNLLQRDLSITEKAKAIYYMSATLKLPNEDIQKKLGISLRFVQASLQLMRLINGMDDHLKDILFNKLRSIKGINRAVQIAKKFVYGDGKIKKNYTTKSDTIGFLKEQLDSKDKEIKRLIRTLQRRDKRIAELETLIGSRHLELTR